MPSTTNFNNKKQQQPKQSAAAMEAQVFMDEQFKEQRKIYDQQEALLAQMITKVDSLNHIARDMGHEVKKQCKDLTNLEYNVGKADIKVKKCSRKVDEFQQSQQSRGWLSWILFGWRLRRVFTKQKILRRKCQ